MSNERQHHWKPCRKLPVLVHYRRAEPGETIETREGVMAARPGDLVIRGVAGEVYPIGPDIFEATYERTDPFDDAMSGGPIEALERRIEDEVDRSIRCTRCGSQGRAPHGAMLWLCGQCYALHDEGGTPVNINDEARIVRVAIFRAVAKSIAKYGAPMFPQLVAAKKP